MTILQELEDKLNFYTQNAPRATPGCGERCYATAQNYETTVLLPIQFEINKIKNSIQSNIEKGNLPENLTIPEPKINPLLILGGLVLGIILLK